VDLAPTKFVVRDAAWKPVFSVIVTQKVEALEIGGVKLALVSNDRHGSAAGGVAWEAGV
jgi:hypothetical protein